MVAGNAGSCSGAVIAVSCLRDADSQIIIVSFSAALPVRHRAIERAHFGDERRVLSAVGRRGGSMCESGALVFCERSVV